ncbi:MAG TPA: hypothetical protein VHW64_12630 [Nocardioides sp.]|uniref:hypothetical protein n=1 Tax=Nocardioides sp. TaxID=35761 RepID=UPI002E367D31|nr:hypothetical protein [Nocardioides sp.]HEX3931544.1 hypothetical protein [Nocardioides sp.]
MGGFARHAARPVEPADTHGSAHPPDEFFDPSRWLPAFAWPPGPLVALVPARHASLRHTTPGLVGVTAASGQYVFLDLPANAVTTSGADELAPPALSPDGRHLAFWTTGRPSGTPNAHLVGATITGVAVCDTTTGAVVSSPLQTVHGLDPPCSSGATTRPWCWD